MIGIIIVYICKALSCNGEQAVNAVILALRALVRVHVVLGL